MARGRPKGVEKTPGSGKWGTPNKVTQDVRAFMQGVVEDPVYRTNFVQAMRDRKVAPAVEFSVDTSKAAICRRCKTGHFLDATETRRVLLRQRLGAEVGADLGAPALRSALEDMGVMEQPIEQGGHGRRVPE